MDKNRSVVKIAAYKGERKKEMKKIGFIGVGIMGKSMVRNLMKAGYELHIYARTKAKVEDVIGEGAIFHETISECVKDCEAVITIVGFPQDVEEVYFDSGNILDSAKKGAYLIDMTTTSPQIAEKLYEEGTKRGFHVLDAPVTGGDTGQEKELFLFLSEAIRAIIRTVMNCLKQWERILITKVRQDADSIANLQTRS